MTRHSRVKAYALWGVIGSSITGALYGVGYVANAPVCIGLGLWGPLAAMAFGFSIGLLLEWQLD